MWAVRFGRPYGTCCATWRVPSTKVPGYFRSPSGLGFGNRGRAISKSATGWNRARCCICNDTLALAQVPQGRQTIAQHFSAGSASAAFQVPLERLKIAQHFSAGYRAIPPTSPEGTTEAAAGKGRPSLSGLGSSCIADPALKCWAIINGPYGTTWNPAGLLSVALRAGVGNPTARKQPRSAHHRQACHLARSNLALAPTKSRA